MTRPAVPAPGSTEWDEPLVAAIYDVSDRIDQEVVDRANADQTTSGPVAIANLPATSILVIAKSGSTWPTRPTSRTDIRVAWLGPDPAPNIVTSGTAGAINNLDLRWRTP
jgi:hypothetical protein